MSSRRFLRLLPCLLAMVLAAVPVWAAATRPVVRTFLHKGRPVDMIVVPGRPPAYRMPAVSLPRVHTKSLSTLSNVPALDWCYGCSATSAAMIFGYYDNLGYPNMYAGPANGGVFPQNNSVWGAGECPLSATHKGYDGLTTRGHVDDYYVAYNSTAPDPWIGNWLQHTYANCTGDYMGSNQSSLGNADGSTTFYYWSDNSPTYDYSASEPANRDGCHGLRLFAESRGYAVLSNYSQYIAGYGGVSAGFTFADFKAEIAAGRPVMIQVANHSMVGLGYDDATQTIYIHDTWDYSTHTMTWGGTYSGAAQYGVTVLQLATLSPPVPIVTASGPTGTTVGVTASLNVGFSVDMSRPSVQTNLLINGVKAATLGGTFTWLGRKMTFKPTQSWQPGTAYKIIIAKGARSRAGVSMGKSFTWTFTTKPTAAAAVTVAAVPTTAGAQITLNLAAAADVTVSIRNLAGREIAVLAPGRLEAGVQSLVWNGKSKTGTRVPGGTYLLQVSANTAEGTSAQAMISLQLR